MRNITTLLLIFFLASCTKPTPAVKEDISQDGCTVLTANIEVLRLDGGKERQWPEGAAIGLFASGQGNNEKYLLRKADAGLSNGLFYGPLIKGDAMAAYYPWERSFSGSSTQFNTLLNADQRYDADKGAEQQFLTYCPTAFSFLTDGRFTFRYPFGMLKVVIDLEDVLTVQRVSLTDSARPLAGQAIVSPAGTSLSEGGWDTITLNCGDEGVNSRDGAVLRPFYLVLPTGSRSSLTLRIGIKGEADPMIVQLKELTIPRIDCADFTIGSIIVGSTGPDSFQPVNVHFDE